MKLHNSLAQIDEDIDNILSKIRFHKRLGNYDLIPHLLEILYIHLYEKEYFVNLLTFSYYETS